MKQTIILSALSLLLCFFTKAQTLSIIGITTTNSTCPANGTITVNASGGTTPYFYSVNNGQEQSLNVFQGLASGSYTVKVRDANNNSVTQTAIVGGSYTLMNPVLSATIESCPGSNTGSIKATIGSNQGSSPFVYSVVSGPTMPPASVATASRSYTFTNLAPGTYSIRVTDSCGEFQTRSITLAGAANYTQTIYSVNARPSSCDSMNFYIRPGFGGRYPYTVYAYPDGNLSGTPITATYTSSADAVPIPGSIYTGFKLTGPNPSTFCNGKYAFVLTDVCNKTTATYNLTMGNVTITNNTTSTCAGNDLQVRIGEGWMFPITVTAAPSNIANPTLTQQVTNDTTRMATFVAPATGSYTVTVTDSCGRQCTYTATVPTVVRTFRFNAYLCAGDLDSTFAAEFYMNGFSAPATVSIISGPATYSSAKINVTSTATYPLTTTITGTGNQYPTFYNLIAGNYVIQVTDTCGNTQQLTVNLSTPNLLIYTIPDLVVSGCPGSMNITSNSSKTCGGFTADVRNVTNNNSVVSIGQNAAASFTLQNMATGTYGITYYTTKTTPALFTNGNAYNGSTTKVIVGYKEATISNSVSSPVIQNVGSANCNGQISVVVLADSTKGKQPYYYAITSGPNGFTVPVQSSPYFTITSYGTYTFQISDSCGNSNSTAIDIQPPVAPDIISSGGSCIGDTIVLSVVTNKLETVSWIKPDNTVVYGDTLSFSPATVADIGTYTVNVTTTVNGCSETTSSSFTINSCLILPVVLVQMNAAVIDKCNGKLTWSAASEPDLSYYEIECSSDGLNFKAIGQQNPNTSGKYSFEVPLNYTSNFFRLKMVDRNGEINYSTVRMLKSDCKENSFSITPNPLTSGDQFYVNFTSTESTNILIRVINANGQCVLKKIARVVAGPNKIPVTFKSATKGLYSVIVISDGAVTSPAKNLIKLQ